MRHFSKPSNLTWLILATIALIAGVCLANRIWISHNLQRMKVERTTRSEIHKLQVPLKALGFSDFSTLKTECDYALPLSATSLQTTKTYSCTSTVSRTAPVPTDGDAASSFRQHSVELSQALDKNGWTQREDLKTITWFKKISQGIDWQPDQLNTKKVNSLGCTVDFFTAFSTAHHESPRMTMMASCYEPNE